MNPWWNCSGDPDTNKQYCLHCNESLSGELLNASYYLGTEFENYFEILEQLWYEYQLFKSNSKKKKISNWKNKRVGINAVEHINRPRNNEVLSYL